MPENIIHFKNLIDSLLWLYSAHVIVFRNTARLQRFIDEKPMIKKSAAILIIVFGKPANPIGQFGM